MLLHATRPPSLNSQAGSRSLRSDAFGTSLPAISPPTAAAGHHVLPRGRLSVTAGGGPKTFPGGVKKWQWKRMLDRKQQNRERKQLDRERVAYEAQRRQFLRVLRGPEKPWEDWDAQRRRTHETPFSGQGLDASSRKTFFSSQGLEQDARSSDDERGSRHGWEGEVWDFRGSSDDESESPHGFQSPWDGDDSSPSHGGEHNGASLTAQEQVERLTWDDGEDGSDSDIDTASLSQLNQRQHDTGWPGPRPNRGSPSSTVPPWLAPEGEEPDAWKNLSKSEQRVGRRVTLFTAGSTVKPAAKRDPRQRRMPWEAAEDSQDPILLQEVFRKMPSEGCAGPNIRPAQLGGSSSRQAAPKAAGVFHNPLEKAQAADSLDRFLSSLIRRGQKPETEEPARGAGFRGLSGRSLPPSEKTLAARTAGCGRSEPGASAQQLDARKGSRNSRPAKTGSVVPPVPQHLLRRLEKRKHALDLWRDDDE